MADFKHLSTKISLVADFLRSQPICGLWQILCIYLYNILYVNCGKFSELGLHLWQLFCAKILLVADFMRFLLFVANFLTWFCFKNKSGLCNTKDLILLLAREE